MNILASMPADDEFILFLGHSACGQTTIIRMIFGPECFRQDIIVDGEGMLRKNIGTGRFQDIPELRHLART
jgi:ABC-type Fe3+/spermidine/putrescine transport system ATPase subunit